MEFPELGSQCSVNNCQTLDFLPIKCAHCHLIFCKNHSQSSYHECVSATDNVIFETSKAESFTCSSESCNTKDPMEMKCVECKKHFCLEHRHHGCLDKEPSQSKRDKHRIPKEQFKKAKAETDKQVDDTLRNAKNRALANKIKFMKIKGSAVGQNNVPTNDRCYFLVAPPLEKKTESTARSFFVDKSWTTGKAIDFFAKKFKVHNPNNSPEGLVLRLFSAEGNIIAKELNRSLEELINDGILLDGDSLILEYVTLEEISKESYLFQDDSIINKYNFI